MSNRDDGMDLLIYDKLKEMNGEKQTEVSVSSFAKDAVSLFEFLGPLFVLVYIAICGFTGMTWTCNCFSYSWYYLVLYADLSYWLYDFVVWCYRRNSDTDYWRCSIIFV